MSIKPTQLSEVTLQTELEGIPALNSDVDYRIVCLALKEAVQKNDWKTFWSTTLVCKCWKRAAEAYLVKPWNKLNMLSIIQGINSYDRLALKKCGIKQVSWDALSPIQKVFCMSGVTQRQWNPADKNVSLTQLYAPNRAELKEVMEFFKESNEISTAILSAPPTVTDSKFLKLKTWLSVSEQPSFLKFYFLRMAASRGLKFSNFSHYITIGTISSERPILFFSHLLEYLNSHTKFSFNETKGSLLHDSLDTILSAAFSTSKTILDLRRALAGYPLTIKNLTLLSVIAYLKSHEELPHTIMQAISRTETCRDILDVYIVALQSFTSDNNNLAYVEYLMGQIRQLLKKTSNPISVDINKLTPFLKCFQKHINEQTAEKFGHLLYLMNIPAVDLIRFLYDSFIELKREFRCAILKGYLRQANKGLVLSLDEKIVSTILNHHYDQDLFHLLLDRIFTKKKETASFVLTLAKNQLTSLSLAVLMRLSERRFDFTSIHILHELAPDACTQEFVEYLMDQGVELTRTYRKRTVCQIYASKVSTAVTLERPRYRKALEIIESILEKENHNSNIKKRKTA